MRRAAQLTRADVEQIIVAALKPILRRIFALEQDSHQPVDPLPVIKKEVARAVRASARRCRQRRRTC